MRMMNVAATLRARQRGLTLVELMVSIAVSLVILSALTYVFVGSRATYRTNEALARVQESGRFAVEWLAREVREAGYFGCGSRISRPEIIADPPVTFTGQLQAVFGYENGKIAPAMTANWPDPTAANCPDCTNGKYLRGDVLLLSGMLGTAANVLDDNPKAVNANIKIDQNCAQFKKNDLVLVTNCARGTIMRITNDPQTTCPADKKSGLTVTDANNVNNENFRLNPPYLIQSRAILFKFSQRAYFIGRNPAGRPALYMAGSNILADQAEEVVEGVEDLDLLFGIDEDKDGSADRYLRADQIPVVASGADWADVVSVRISLVAVSPDQPGATIQPQTILFRDSDGDQDKIPDPQTSNDRLLRQVFTTTIALRNRLP